MFAIHPRDLCLRRKRCHESVQRLHKVSRDPHYACNVCEGRETVLLASSDRYGIQVRTVLCKTCGLIYLCDRLSADAYSEFYTAGAYRELTAKFSGQKPRLEALQLDQVSYAARVIESLESCPDIPAHRFLLDIGGSAGVVASSVGAHFGCASTVIDPAVEEIAAAESIGLEGVVASLETYQTEKAFDIILLCRSIEHLFDLRSSMRKIRRLLSPGGVFYCDIVDFVETCRTGGGIEAITKIDHCYWLCQETAPAIFAAAGFEIISMDVSSQPETIGYLLRAGPPADSIRAPQGVTDALVRQLREINSDWRSYGNTATGPTDWLRRMSYRAKRKIARLADAAPIPLRPRRAPAAASRPALDPANRLALGYRSSRDDS